MGLEYVGNKYYRCKKDGGLYLINSETLKPMFDEPIEAMLQSLNGPEFVVKKNGLSVVFDMKGKQLTDYLPGSFDWKWAKDDFCFKRIIFNEIAIIELSAR